ncbi:MAG TPA: DNA-binding transcriptional regulator [Planctomycetota bacterium]
MRARPAVALLIETSNAYARGLLEGIMAYVREHKPWSIYLPEQGRGAAPPAWLARWKGDGLIVRVETKEIARAVVRKRKPVVDVSAGRFIPSIPWVETDDQAIAKAAAAHLLERGFRRLAFCGDARFNWSKHRRTSFEALAREAGAELHVHDAPLAQEHDALVAWVRRLPKPVGVFAAYDIKAQQLLDACRDAGVAVPEEVAVVGVDNDELLCRLATPPLSSVVPNTGRTGYEAARLLDRLLRGEKVAPEAHLVPPLGVHARQSTDILAVEDREVAAAMRFIREHACDGITVEDVLRAVPLSRRVLERRFRKVARRTPHEEILRLRLERVKQLLAESDLSLERISTLAGFAHPEYMSVAFKREVGVTPGCHRLQIRPQKGRA